MGGYGLSTVQQVEDKVAGLANMTKDIASQIADDRIDEVLEAFPLKSAYLLKQVKIDLWKVKITSRII